MAVSWRIQMAVGKVAGFKRPPDQNQCRAGEARRLDLIADIGQRPAQNMLVWPGSPIDHCHRAICAIKRGQVTHHRCQIVDRKMNG